MLSTLLRLSTVSAVLAAALTAQNLVQNPSFESYSLCPVTIGQVDRCDAWINPTTATPDYCNACASAPVADVPTNAWGSEPAHTGGAYASLIVYSTVGGWREYVEAPLTTALSAGQTYEISFWVSHADKSRWAIANLGAYLSVGSVSPFASSNEIPVTPQLESTSVITNKTGWTKISGTFVAAGGESHIVIGNFRNNAGTTAVDVGGVVKWSIYYIDDVSVVRKTPASSHPQLVGWSDLPQPASFGFIDVQDVDANCKPAVTRCRTTAPVRAPAPYAGGTAYDPRYQTVWVSDGQFVAEDYLIPGKSCRARCPGFKAVTADPRALVSGLAHADRSPRLFQLATRPGYMEITTYDNRGRCPRRLTTCRRSLAANAIAGGLAYDEVNDRLFVTVSTQSSTGTWSTSLFTSRPATPCAFVCQARIFTCSQNLVTGLAYDTCKRHLYATDGQVTQTMTVVSATQCLIKLGSCCKKQLSPVYRGLAVIPAWKRKTVGKSCTSELCQSCPAMTIGSAGDPSLGAGFVVTLDGAPTGGFAMLAIKLGSAGTGISLPAPFCGNWYAFPALTTFAPAALGGTGACGGSASQTFPIPVNPMLCGVPMTAQWFVFCKGATGFGLGLSNGLEFTVAGS